MSLINGMAKIVAAVLIWIIFRKPTPPDPKTPIDDQIFENDEVNKKKTTEPKDELYR